MAAAAKFMRFSWLFCFRYHFSFANSTQSGNSSNYSLFSGENSATSCYVVTVLALAGLTKELVGHYAFLKIFSFRSRRGLSKLWKFLPWFLARPKLPNVNNVGIWQGGHFFQLSSSLTFPWPQTNFPDSWYGMLVETFIHSENLFKFPDFVFSLKFHDLSLTS